MNWEAYDGLIDAALEEDAARRDVTTSALVPSGRRGEAEVRARAAGVVCGLPLARRLAARFDEQLRFEERVRDGDQVAPGAVVAVLGGPAAAILSVERTMLNFLQRLSGIATLTRQFVQEVEGTGAAIYDTRKTTPGWRTLEKYAVRCGGGRNHRMDLAAQALIKDNHLALLTGAAPGLSVVQAAIEKVRAANPGLIIEVEVETLADLEAALGAAPDIIMLDNMTPGQVREAAALVRKKAGDGGRPLLESSGTVTLATVRDYAEAGADMISVGALTHSARAFDLSLDMKS